MTFIARSLRLKLFALFSGCLIAAAVLAQGLQILELRHRTADEVLPILQPLLEPGGALSGQNDRLFVRASAQNVAQLRAALAQIDRPARQLRISVRQGSQHDSDRGAVAASGTLRTDRGSVAVNENGRSAPGVTVRGAQTHATGSGESIASVLVLEGGAAFIATGASAPFVTAVAGGAGRRGRWGGASIEYRELQSGFLVTPRVRGNVAVLDIEQRSEALERGQIDVQQLTTQATAPLGEWVQLGAVSETAAHRSGGVAERSYQTRSSERTLWVKVEAE